MTTTRAPSSVPVPVPNNVPNQLSSDVRSALTSGSGFMVGSSLTQLGPVKDVIDMSNEKWSQFKSHLSNDYACIEIPSTETDLIIQFRKHVAKFNGTSKYTGGGLQYFGDNVALAVGGIFTDEFVVIDHDIKCGEFKRKVNISVELTNNSLMLKTKNDYRTALYRYDDSSYWTYWKVGNLSEVDFDSTAQLTSKIRSALTLADEKLLKYKLEKYNEASPVRNKLKLLNKQISRIAQQKVIVEFMQNINKLQNLQNFINEFKVNSADGNMENNIVPDDFKVNITPDTLANYENDLKIKRILKMYTIHLRSIIENRNDDEIKDENIANYFKITEICVRQLDEITALSKICQGYVDIINIETIKTEFNTQWSELEKYYKDVNFEACDFPVNPFTNTDMFINERRNNTKFLRQYWDKFVTEHYTSTEDQIYVYQMNERLEWNGILSKQNSVIIPIERAPHAEICRNLVIDYKKHKKIDPLGIFTYGEVRKYKSNMCYWMASQMKCGIFDINLRLAGLGGILKNKLSSINHGIILFDEFSEDIPRMTLNQGQNNGFVDLSDIRTALGGILHINYPCIVYITGNSIVPFLQEDLSLEQKGNIIQIFKESSGGKEVPIDRLNDFLTPFSRSLFSNGRINHILYFADDEKYITKDMFGTSNGYELAIIEKKHQEEKKIQEELDEKKRQADKKIQDELEKKKQYEEKQNYEKLLEQEQKKHAEEQFSREFKLREELERLKISKNKKHVHAPDNTWIVFTFILFVLFCISGTAILGMYNAIKR